MEINLIVNLQMDGAMWAGDQAGSFGPLNITKNTKIALKIKNKWKNEEKYPKSFF